MSEECKDADARDRWCAVYGAMVALQVRDRMKAGHAPPDVELMRRYVEEAEAVADLAAEARESL